MPRPDQIPPVPQKPEQERPDPTFTLKEQIRLQGMKWLQDRGLQYESARDDGKDLYLRSERPRQ